MTVIVPSDGVETRQVIHAIADYSGPVYVRLGRSKVPVVMPDDYTFQIGRAYSFHTGKDANIVAMGIMLPVALESAKILRSDGLDVGVINMSTVKPLDTQTLLSASKACRLIVTAEEHSIIGGLGSAVSEFLSENYPMKLIRIGIKDDFGCSGTSGELLELYGLTSDNVVKTIHEALKK
jgi:transketolase